MSILRFWLLIWKISLQGHENNCGSGIYTNDETVHDIQVFINNNSMSN